MTVGDSRVSESQSTEDGFHPDGNESTRTCFLFESAQDTRVVRVAPGETLTVGRASPSDVVIRDRSLSRTHARFGVDAEGEAFVEDLESTNATRVNGQKVTRSRI